MFWPILNVTAGMVVAAIVIYKLTFHIDKFTPMERIGLGMIGAGMVLTIGPLTSTQPTPYEDWSGTLIRFGCALYFIGRVTRHSYWNRIALQQAERHLKERGQ